MSTTGEGARTGDGGATERDVACALAGDAAALGALVRRLAPVIVARVRRVVEIVPGRTPDQVRQLGEDLLQEVFVSLVQDDWRVLRSWDPTRGLTLEGYVGLVASNLAASTLRNGRRSAWREDPTEDAALVDAVGGAAPESTRLQARDTLTRLVPRLRSELSARGAWIFELLVLEPRPLEEVARLTGLDVAALHAWKSRIGKLATRIAAELDAPARHPSGGHRSPSGTRARRRKTGRAKEGSRP